MRPASGRTPSSLQPASKLRNTTTTTSTPGAAAARASGGGALLFASGAELPDDPPVPLAAAPEVDAAPSAVGGARGRPRRVGPRWVRKSSVGARWVKKGPVVVPNASARWDSLGSDGVSHRPVLVLPEWYETLACFFVDFYEALDGIVNLESIDDPVCRRAHDVARRRRDGDPLPEWYETDACYFVDFFEALESIDDPDIRRANDALKKHYAWVKKKTKDDIPWAEVDKKRYLCGEPQGIVCAHYSPSVEAGPVTNAGMNVHISASEKDGERTRLKQKSVCLRFQSQAIALETAEHHDGYTVVRVVEPVEGVPGAMVERFVAVQNSSAALLHFDVFERWPCVDGNDVDIEGAVRKRLGPKALVEGDNLFANLIQARRLYVAKKFGGEPPPVMVWNRGTTDGVTFGGAQVGTFESLKITCGEKNVSSTYHMAFMMRKSLAMKVAAPYADAAMREFISRARPGALKFPKKRRDGYWAFFHEVAEITDEERRVMREEFLAFMRELRKRVSDAWEAFEAGTADDKQLAMIEAMMEGSAKGRKTISDAREAARAMVEAMTEGLATSRKTISAAVAAFRAGKADDAQLAMVVARMKGLAKGRKTISAAVAAFEAGDADDAQLAIVEAQMESIALAAVWCDFENGTTTSTEEQLDIARRLFAPRMTRWGKSPAEIIIWRNQDAALAAFEPGTGVSVPTRVPGFKNRGNTCFLAATAQVLCGLSAFAGDLVALPDASSPGALGFGSAFEGAAGADARGAPSPGSRGGVASALRALVRARDDHASLFDNPVTRASATASLDPSQLKEAIQSRHVQYQGNEQHDAHEFLGHTLQALSQEVAGNGVSSARSPTCRFEGAFTTTFRCEECETYACSSTEPEWFRWLSLDLPDSDTGSAEPLELEGLIARYFAPETVEKLCERDGCDGTHAEMARQLIRAPEALLVHLKRYRTEGEGLNLRYVKDSREVELPMTVTLAPHDGVSAAADPDSPADEAAASTRVCAEDDSVAGEAARSQLASYRLAGVVSHFGEAMNGGHYVASARVDVGGETTAKCWMSFNDEEVCYVESPAYAESTPEDWYLAVFEYAPDSDETVADAASEPDAFQFGKISEACKYLLEDAGPDGLSVATLTQQIQEGNLAQLGGKKPNNSVAERLRLNALFEKVAHGVYRLADGVGAAVQEERASEPDAFQFGTIGEACKYLLEDAGPVGLSASTLAREIQKRKLAKLGGKTPNNSVAARLRSDARFVNVALSVFALAKLKDSSPHLFSSRAALDWVQEAYLGDGNGVFVPGDGEDDVEFLTESASLAPLKASDGYKAGVQFKVSSMRAAMSPPGSLYSDVYNCLQNECKFSTWVSLPVGASTGVSRKVATFLKSFLYKVRKLADADVNAINAAADAAAAEKKKKAKKARKAKKRAR